MENTKIGWADDTVGFWWGCTERGPGCANCYAREGYPVMIAESQIGLPLWQSNSSSESVRSVRMHIGGAQRLMHRLNRKAEKAGQPRIVFINSQSDSFEETDAQIIRRFSPKVAAECGHTYEVLYNNEGEFHGRRPDRDYSSHPMPLWTLDDERRLMFETIDKCQHLLCLLLTKRPENIQGMWQYKGDGFARPGSWNRTNVWLGTSVACQADADRNVPLLLNCRDLAPVLFLSLEPMIERVILHPWIDSNGFHNSQGVNVDWIIVGAESEQGGPARPCDIEWIRDIVRQCKEAGVPCFVKQIQIDGKATDDVTKFPVDLQVQQFPK